MVAFTITAARNLAAALLVMACVGGGVATAQTTTTAASGDTVTIGVGSRDGVRVGMTGRITKQEMVGGQLQSFEIARFRVTAVESASCSAQLTDVGEGWKVESGMEVVFDQALVAPRLDTATLVIRSNVAGDVAYLDGRRLGSTPQRVEVAPGEHTVRVEKDGYEAAERRVSLFPGKESLVIAELTRGGELSAASRETEKQAELLFWESIKDSDDPGDFQEYLNRWPSGIFSGLARKRVGASEKPVRTGKIATPVQRSRGSTDSWADVIGRGDLHFRNGDYAAARDIYAEPARQVPGLQSCGLKYKIAYVLASNRGPRRSEFCADLLKTEAFAVPTTISASFRAARNLCSGSN